MSTTINQMTTEEFRTMLESIVEKSVEKKMFEILGDPDIGLEIRQSVMNRLKRQQKAVANGKRGRSFKDIVAEPDIQ